MRHRKLEDSKCPSCHLPIVEGEEFLLHGYYYHDLCAINHLLQIMQEKDPSCRDHIKK